MLVKQYFPGAYILEDDTDDVSLIEYDFGCNGKHFLVVNLDRREANYLNTLKENFDDEFEYVLSTEDDEFDCINYDAIDDNCD